MSTRLQGPVNSATVAGEQTRVKKYYREQLDQLDKFGNIPQTFTDRYGAMFWTMFYLKTRMAETGVKLNYRKERVGITSGYAPIQDQLDQLYHDMTDGKLGVAATTGSWYIGITSVKTLFPKT